MEVLVSEDEVGPEERFGVAVEPLNGTATIEQQSRTAEVVESGEAAADRYVPESLSGTDHAAMVRRHRNETIGLARVKRSSSRLAEECQRPPAILDWELDCRIPFAMSGTSYLLVVGKTLSFPRCRDFV